jgi:polyisoprenyl-teichoic acid--peptidoglycan teichoic acid transferase
MSAQASGGEEYRMSDPAARRRGSLEQAPARLRVERDRRRSRGKKIALVVVSTIISLVLLAAISVLAFAMYVQSSMSPQTKLEKESLALALAPSKPMDPYNVLILGVDARPEETQSRSDSILVAHIDPATKRMWLVSIPRDTKVTVPGYGEHKINDAHFLGGPQLAVKTVSQFTGLKINHYLEVNFSCFEAVVRKMGGVWVDVPVAINDIQADRSPHHRAAKIPAGYQRLDAWHALTFMRARHQFLDQDFTRMRNQQIFFKAVADQLSKTSNVVEIPGIITVVARYIRTDMSLMDMIKTGMALREMGGKNMYTTTVMGEWVSPYVIPDQIGLAKIVSDIKAERSFEGTKTAKAAKSGSKASSKKPSQVTVTVRNGAGFAGAASQAGSILKAQGFRVPTVGNANQNVYNQTLVIYKTDIRLAQLVAGYLPPNTKIVQSRGLYSFKTSVLVIVGKDWDIAKVPAAPIQTQ